MKEQYFKILLAITTGTFLMSILWFLDNVLAIGIIFGAFLVGLTLILLKKFGVLDKRILLIFFIAFIIHGAFVLFLYYSHFQPFGDGGGDYDGYHAMAKEISLKLHKFDFSLGEALKWGHIYPVIMGYIYALTIPDMFIGQIFNTWIVGLVAILSYLLAFEITGDKKGSFFVGIISIFYPSLLFYGSLMLKDAMVVLFLMLGALMFIRLLKEFSWKDFIYLYLSAAVLFNFRFYIGYALILSFMFFGFIFSEMKIRQRLFRVLIFFVIFGSLPYFFSNQGFWGISTIKEYLNKDSITMYREVAYTEKNLTTPQKQDVDIKPQVDDKNQGLLVNVAKIIVGNITRPEVSNGIGSSFEIKTNFNKPILFVLNMGESFIYTLLGPLPWQIRGLRQLAVLVETIPWYIILYIVSVGIIKNIRLQYKNILSIIGLSFVMLGVVSLFIANFGVITRIRMPAFILISCLIPFGLFKFPKITHFTEGLYIKAGNFLDYLRIKISANVLG